MIQVLQSNLNIGARACALAALDSTPTFVANFLFKQAVFADRIECRSRNFGNCCFPSGKVIVQVVGKSNPHLDPIRQATELLLGDRLFANATGNYISLPSFLFFQRFALHEREQNIFVDRVF
jgi:hypothetical protein